MSSRTRLLPCIVHHHSFSVTHPFSSNSERQQGERRQPLRDHVSEPFLEVAVLRECDLEAQRFQDLRVCLRLARQHRVECMHPEPTRSHVTEPATEFLAAHDSPSCFRLLYCHPGAVVARELMSRLGAC